MRPARPNIADAAPGPRALPLALASLALASLALRLFRLDAQSLWLDEGGSWAEVTGRTGKGWLALVSELWSPNAGYPLYHLLLKGWVALAGDSEWALRFPSALAGALAVVAVFLAASELAPAGRRWRALLPALIVAASPFALWHSQDAKAYSLLLLTSALVGWALLRALRSEARGAWLLLLALALLSLLVHRLALLSVAGVALAVGLARGSRTENREPRTRPPAVDGTRPALSRRWPWLLVAGAIGAGGVAGTILAARGEAAGVERASVNPLEGLGLVLARFSLDRWPGDVGGYLGLPAALWLAPFAALGLWGLALLARDARARRREAIGLLCLLLAPLGLYGLALALAPVFQARYAVPAFPAWALALCYPMLREPRTKNQEPAAARPYPRLSALGSVLYVLALIAGAATLVQPAKGLFSGAPVKEQWREAVAALAARAQPDDLVIVQPYYVLPMYEYYAPRVTPDPLPRPVTFPIFAAGDTGAAATRAELLEHVRRRYEPFFNQEAAGRKRALLLIAPDHAATVDPPRTLAELVAAWEQRGGSPDERPTAPDTYGWLGLRFQYPQRTWPCGGAEFLGVAVMCQSFPERFSAGAPSAPPEPETATSALFGGELRLRGYTLSPHGGELRPGGTLPITLYWEAAGPPSRRYRMFLHLCRDCEQPPAAGADGPPLEGYPPAGDTTTWQVGDPVHDERALALPAALPPGRYTLLLGVYPDDDPRIEARLPVDAPGALPNGRLVLAEVEVAAP